MINYRQGKKYSFINITTIDMYALRYYCIHDNCEEEIIKFDYIAFDEKYNYWEQTFLSIVQFVREAK